MDRFKLDANVQLEYTLNEIAELLQKIQEEMLKLEAKKVTVRARKAVQKDLKGKMGDSTSNIHTL